MEGVKNGHKKLNWRDGKIITSKPKIEKSRGIAALGTKMDSSGQKGIQMKIFHQQADPMELRREASCRHRNVKQWDKAIRANEALNYSIQRVRPGFRTKLFLSYSLGQEEKIGIEKNGKKKNETQWELRECRITKSKKY